MAIPFIWKKQLVMFVTMFVVVMLGLAIGGFLHDRFGLDPRTAQQQAQEKVGQKQAQMNFTNSNSANSAIQTPSLAFPTTQPGVTPPKK